MERKRCTNKELLDRLSIVLELKVQGHEYTKIIRFCIEKWQVSEATAKRYLREAQSMITLTPDGVNSLLDIQIIRAEKLFSRYKDEQPQIALKALERIDKTIELKSKQRRLIPHEVNEPDSRFMSQDTLAEALRFFEGDQES